MDSVKEYYVVYSELYGYPSLNEHGTLINMGGNGRKKIEDSKQIKNTVSKQTCTQVAEYSRNRLIWD